MRRKWILLWFIICFSNLLSAQQTNKPLLQHTKYFTCTIKPNYLPQLKLDAQVNDFYIQWKKRFVRSVPGKPQSFIWFENKGGKQSVSEGQGYGMIISVLMAKKDPASKQEYDDLFHYYRAHPSNKSKFLMAWAQTTKGADLDRTSATDGDMDIAYSLLLADEQWGSNGAIDYLKEAKASLGAIMQYEINQKTWSILLSDAVEWDSKDYYATRSSDFMPSHFKAFELATHDAGWKKVIDASYKLFDSMVDKYSPEAGLLPDFIVDINHIAKPAPPHFLESQYDGCYNYNACRDPWRIALDYIITGDKRSKTISDKINRWIRTTTNNNTYNLSAGYTLAGSDLKNRYFEALSFSAPFAVSAMVDKDNQQWLNSLWDYLTAFKMKDFDYYDNSIKLLNMIIISGNYRSY